jgi:hypothetical protein
MKINKSLRNLIMKQSECLMLSGTSCVYQGTEYTFEKVSSVEVEELRMKILKELDKEAWADVLLKRLGSFFKSQQLDPERRGK